MRTALACAGGALETALRLLSDRLPHVRVESQDGAIVAPPKVDAQVEDGRPQQQHPPEAGETVRFALDGQAYEIDLSREDADALRATLGQYIAAGRPVDGEPPREPDRGRRRRTAPADHGGDTAAIRAWARAHGHPVSDRGRLPASIREAYRAAQ